MGELGALFNPGMRHELEERQAKAARREEEGNARDGDLRIDLESGVAVINVAGAEGVETGQADEDDQAVDEVITDEAVVTDEVVTDDEVIGDEVIGDEVVGDEVVAAGSKVGQTADTVSVAAGSGASESAKAGGAGTTSDETGSGPTAVQQTGESDQRPSAALRPRGKRGLSHSTR